MKESNLLAFLGVGLLCILAILTYPVEEQEQKRVFVSISEGTFSCREEWSKQQEQVESTTQEVVTAMAAVETQKMDQVRNLMLSKEDYDILLQIVEAEATGGSSKSKQMVANVVLNRVADEHFPDTVREVVFQKTQEGTAQFSPTEDGRFYSVQVTKATKRAVAAVLEGKDESQGALFFLNRATANSEARQWFDGKLQYLFDCGGHSFYGYEW